MAEYFSFNDLKALIPGAFLVQALDDDGDGVVDAFTAVQDQAQGEVDAHLSARFAVPILTNIPPIAKRASMIIAAELCYQRRGTPPDQNPWGKQASAMRKTLEMIASGKIEIQVSPASPEPVKEAGSLVEYDSPLGTPSRPLA